MGERVEWEGGKCCVPMWASGSPSGHCGEPAFGPQYPDRLLQETRCGFDRPYCYGPCCPKHGGPRPGEPIVFRDGSTPKGRPMWCAVMPGFINLQESAASFSADPVRAVAALLTGAGDGGKEGQS